MADMTGIASLPPGVDPTEWVKTQRQLSLAQALQSMALSPVQNDLQQPAGGGKYYQAARVGKVAALSKLADALMANKGFTGQYLPGVGDPGQGGALGKMAQQYGQAQQAFAPGGQPVAGTPLQTQPIAADPNEQSVQPALQRAPGQSFAQTVQGAQPGVTPQNPYNPQGLPPAVMMRLYQSDPAKYAAMVAGPEAVQMGQLAGIPRQQAAQAAFAKANSIPARAGEDVMIPDGKGGYVHVRNPVLSAGEAPITDAQGNVVGVQGLPGHLGYQTALTGAETGAKEQNTPRMIPQGGGVEKLGYPPTPPALQPPPGQAPQSKYFGGAPPPPSMPQAPPSSRAPAPGSQEPWLQNLPKLQVPSTPGSTTDAFHQKLLTDAAVRHSELTQKFGNEADLADQKLQYNSQAMKYLAGAETGPSSNWLTEHRANLQEWGVPDALIPGVGKTTDTMELNKNLKQSALQGARSIFGSRMTQMEVKLQHDELSPSTSMTKDAIASLVQQDNIKANYAKQRANDYDKYVTAGGNPLQFEHYYSSKRPLTRYAAQYTTPPAAIDRVQKNPALLGDFKDKYGWDPTQ
jgi:hypothetical protein